MVVVQKVLQHLLAIGDHFENQRLRIFRAPCAQQDFSQVRFGHRVVERHGLRQFRADCQFLAEFHFGFSQSTGVLEQPAQPMVRARKRDQRITVMGGLLSNSFPRCQALSQVAFARFGSLTAEAVRFPDAQHLRGQMSAPQRAIGKVAASYCRTASACFRLSWGRFSIESEETPPSSLWASARSERYSGTAGNSL